MNILLECLEMLIWTIMTVNFLTLVFFNFVGSFESTEINSILTNIIGVVTLSTTISVAIIYGVVLFNCLLIRY